MTPCNVNVVQPNLYPIQVFHDRIYSAVITYTYTIDPFVIYTILMYLFFTDPAGERFPDVRRPFYLCWHRDPLPFYPWPPPSSVYLLQPYSWLHQLTWLPLFSITLLPCAFPQWGCAPSPCSAATSPILHHHQGHCYYKKCKKKNTKLIDVGLTMMTREESK